MRISPYSSVPLVSEVDEIGDGCDLVLHEKLQVVVVMMRRQPDEVHTVLLLFDPKHDEGVLIRWISVRERDDVLDKFRLQMIRVEAIGSRLKSSFWVSDDFNRSSNLGRQ